MKYFYIKSFVTIFQNPHSDISQDGILDKHCSVTPKFDAEY